MNQAFHLPTELICLHILFMNTKRTQLHNINFMVQKIDPSPAFPQITQA